MVYKEKGIIADEYQEIFYDGFLLINDLLKFLYDPKMIRVANNNTFAFM